MAFQMVYGDRPYWLQYIFDGKVYQATKYYGSITKSGGSVNLLVRVGKYLNDDTSTTPRLVHILNRTIEFESGGGYTVEIYEAPTITATGTEIEYETTMLTSSFSNLNRQSDIKQNSVVNLYYGATFTGGTKYGYEFVPTGDFKKGTGAFATSMTERILQPNTDYIIKITNNGTTSDGTGILTLLWYESGE